MQIDTACLMVLLVTIFRRNDSKPFKNNSSTRTTAMDYINERTIRLRLFGHTMLRDGIDGSLDHLVNISSPLRSYTSQTEAILKEKSISLSLALNLMRKARIYQTSIQHESYVPGTSVLRPSKPIVNITLHSTNNSKINHLQQLSLATKEERNDSSNFAFADETEKQKIRITLHSVESPSQTKPPEVTSYNSPFQLDINITRKDDRRMDIVPYCFDPKAPCACDVIPRIVGNQNENENMVNEFVCNMAKTDLSIIPANFRCRQLFSKRKMKSLNKFVTLKSGCELRCIADCKRLNYYDSS